MAACPQDPVFHAEGDVAIHTKMVVEALEASAYYQTLPKGDREVLLLAALWHDIAKPKCTLKDEEGHIRAPKHALVGEKIVRSLYWDLPFAQRERICALVRLHGLPIWCLDKVQPLQALTAASLRLPLRQLHLLAQADVEGRISVGQDDFLERVSLFEAYAVEQHCWEQAFTFANAHSKFHFFHKMDEYPATLYDDTNFEITILSGLPGSGKDSFAATLDQPVISLDDIRKELKIAHTDRKGQGKVAQLAYQRAKHYAAKKISFVWNSTNLTRQLRQRLVNTLSVYQPYIRMVYLQTSKATYFERRKGQIPKATLEQLLNMVELPQRSEAHEVIYLQN